MAKFPAFLGPGLITGASDDDPSGIATYSQVGAQFGYGMTWVMLFSYPLMAAIQEISARIGRVTGQGIASNIRSHYPAWLLRVIVALLLAPIRSISAPISVRWARRFACLSAVRPISTWSCSPESCAGLEIFVRYERYVRILKWGTLSLFAYVATVLVVEVPWRTVVVNTLVPSFTWHEDYIVSIVAVLGTTISPYLFFWQASEEAEDEFEAPDEQPLILAPEQAAGQIHRIRLDTYVGMGFSNLIALFIIITTAATLNANGITDIQTSSQAAEALRPVAGVFTFALFAAGIIGTGMLAVPVLAGSAAYALGEAFGWPTGLARLPLDAKAFYGTVAVATLIGAFINFVDIDPIKALFWSAVINGVVAVPLMVVMMLMTMRPEVMGPFTLPRSLWVLGWLSTATMALSVIIMFVTW